jgi:hypothetical protein
MVALSKRNRTLRKQAEEGVGVFLTTLLEQAAALALNQRNDHGQNNQDFLDFLNTATAEIRSVLEKQPRIRRVTTKSKKLPSPAPGSGVGGEG